MQNLIMRRSAEASLLVAGVLIKPLRLISAFRPIPTYQVKCERVFDIIYWSFRISPSIQSWMISFISFLLMPAW